MEQTRTHLPHCPTHYQNILGTDSFFTEMEDKKEWRAKGVLSEEGVGDKMKTNCVLGRHSLGKHLSQHSWL